jgi:hypothetical protein
MLSAINILQVLKLAGDIHICRFQTLEIQVASQAFSII